MTRIVPDKPTKPFCGLMIIGEAPGEQEIEQGIPFVGKSGALLDKTLFEVGIDRASCYVTNVFMTRPPDNKVDHFFFRRGEDDPLTLWPPLRGKFVRPEHEFEMFRLMGEFTVVAPHTLVLLGGTALWAMMGIEGITAARGQWKTVVNARKIIHVMPTWHPSAVLRDMTEKKPEFVNDFTIVAKRLKDG